MEGVAEEASTAAAAAVAAEGGGDAGGEANSDRGLSESKGDSMFKVPSLPSKAKNAASSGTSSSSSSEQAEPPPLPYTEPTWSSTPSEPYVLTVIKTGTIIQTVQLSNQPYHTFGRLPSCDIQLEHPSVSRYHAVLQYRPPLGEEESSAESNGDSAPSSSISVNPKEEGFYVYDLGSTHGTYLNKSKIQMRCYYRLRLGQMVKFGGSSRLFLLEVQSQDRVEVVNLVVYLFVCLFVCCSE